MKRFYKICVIDDIKTVVNGIVNAIPWTENGIEVVGTSFNGEDALRMVYETKPDIVLTDISMPKMNGIEMTKSIMEFNPFCKIIFISGYTDFEYTQQAIQMGAFDYIQKPFRAKQILEVVLKARLELEQEEIRQSQVEVLERKVRESIPVLRQEYFNLLIRFYTSPESARERWDFLQMDMEREHFVVLSIEIDQFSDKCRLLPIKEVELFRFAIQNILEETLAIFTHAIVFRDDLHRFVVVMNPSQLSATGQIAEKCRENVETYTRHTISMGYGLEVTHIHELSNAYQQSIAALTRTFYFGGNSVYGYENNPDFKHAVVRYSMDKEKELLYCLRSGNKKKASDILDTIFAECAGIRPLPKPNELVSIYTDLAKAMYDVFLEKISQNDMEMFNRAFKAIKNGAAYTLVELQCMIKQFSSLGCDSMHQQHSLDAHDLINLSIRYIQEHLQYSLTVNDCAKQVHLSASYYANMFKKVTSMTVNQFVTNARIDRAKEMLAEGRQVQEVALAVGYEDRPYFSDVFKKITGETPSDFRAQYAVRTKE